MNIVFDNLTAFSFRHPSLHTREDDTYHALSKAIAARNAKFVDIFIVHLCPHLIREHFVPRRFFQHILRNVRSYICHQPIYFNLADALYYCSFIGGCSLVLHGRVPETAIQGKMREIALNPHLISSNDILGCYPGWQGGQEFIHNPYKNSSF